MATILVVEDEPTILLWTEIPKALAVLAASFT